MAAAGLYPFFNDVQCENRGTRSYAALVVCIASPSPVFWVALPMGSDNGSPKAESLFIILPP